MSNTTLPQQGFHLYEHELGATPIFQQIASQSPLVALAVGVIILLFLFGVIYPAVWSKKAARRKAALAVIERILRRRR
ncbi:hypothetical protein [Nonomuraea guangzhouensis]|uniref:Uncharacterized protein n=1 Tax=Nonomuraea guangzhouensis TaxID=1291555 RepID=A0ABW4GWU5_9ACTN|nr:hypothetical protein [Nonomuraea guangzhouensis]